MCIAFVGIVITAALTAMIIQQTKKLNQQQADLELKLNLQQTNMQKRQLRVDTYPYKREIYCNVFAILEFCNALKDLSQTVKFKGKSASDMLTIFQEFQKQYVPDVKAAMWSMREAEYVLPDNIYPVIIDIRKNFDEMYCHFIIPEAIEKELSSLEMQSQMAEIINSNVTEALVNCNNIMKHASFIESVMPSELDIGAIAR